MGAMSGVLEAFGIRHGNTAFPTMSLKYDCVLLARA
jgi:hypothetical protein